MTRIDAATGAKISQDPRDPRAHAGADRATANPTAASASRGIGWYVANATTTTASSQASFASGSSRCSHDVPRSAASDGPIVWSSSRPGSRPRAHRRTGRPADRPDPVSRATARVTCGGRQPRRCHEGAIGQDGPRRPVRRDAAVVEDDDAVAHRREQRHVVRHADDGRPVGPHAVDDLGDAPARAVILAGGGLVEDEHARVHGEHGGDRHELAHRERQPVRVHRQHVSSAGGSRRPTRCAHRSHPPPRPGCAGRKPAPRRPSARRADDPGSGTRSRRDGRAPGPGARWYPAPSTTTRPDVGRRRPLRCLASVVLPDPFWPTMPRVVPRAISSETPSSAATPPG